MSDANVPTDHRSIAIALVSEIRNALVPARYDLDKLGETALAARVAVQRVLDYATACAAQIDRLEERPG